MKSDKRVLVVATSRKTRGGITSVVKAHEQGPQWNEYHCHWIQTHIDRGPLQKIVYFISGLISFLLRLPSATIVHVHLAAVERKMPFIFLSKLFGKKTIVHFHFPNPTSTIDNPSKSWKYRWCAKKADIVLVLSDSWKRQIQEHYGVDNVQVLYNPCPDIKQIAEPTEPPYILYAGTLSERKGYADMLNAFAKVYDKMPGWRLKFAGNGEIVQARNLAINLGIADKVDFLGWINGNDKDRAFREASAYCLPSYAEGFPMGVLDAWAYGLPVLTTPVGGLPEILSDGVNALVFNPGDIDAMADSFVHITNSEIRARLTKESLNLASTKFNVTNICTRLGEIYANLIHNA